MPFGHSSHHKTPLSAEVRFRAKVNDRVPAHELSAWADKIEKLEDQVKELA
jgi:hypothetical protein